MPHLNHIGLYGNDIEEAKHFFEKNFDAQAGEKYHNPRKSFSSYLLSFYDGAILEIMTRPGLNSMCDRTNICSAAIMRLK